MTRFLEVASLQDPETQKMVKLSGWMFRMDRLLSYPVPRPGAGASQPDYEAVLRIWREIGNGFSFKPDDIRVHETSFGAEWLTG